MEDNYGQIMEYLIGIKESQAEVKAKQFATHEIVVKLEKKVGRQNGRITKLELWKSYLVGGSATVGIIFGIIWKFW